MWISASAVSHPGNCREKNEDNFCLNGRKLSGSSTLWPFRFCGRTSAPILMGVFDGMGGMKAGEVASGIASDAACAAVPGLTGTTDITAALLDICSSANEQTCSRMLRIKQRIGTTASMLCFRGGRYYLCNIGDSPIYLFRDDRLSPIFCEHTERENYLRIRGADAAPRKKYRLTQNIGIFPEEMGIEPFVSTGDLKYGDRFLIASDGLTDMVEEAEIAGVLRERTQPAKTVSRLLELALAYGGKDNVTIICVDIR